jgi:hypothetical protein
MNAMSTLSSSRSQGSSLVTAVVVLCVTVVALAATGAAAAAGASHDAWKYWQLDGDRCYDAATIDRNGNDRAEVIWFDIDNDCDLDTRVWNSVGGEQFLESLTFDMNEDSRWEVWLADTNQREGFELIFWDDSRDGRYDRWNYVANVVPKTLQEVIAEQTQAASVVSAPEYDGVPRLLNILAAATGRPTYGSPPDADGDKCEQRGYRDNYPLNQNRC